MKKIIPLIVLILCSLPHATTYGQAHSFKLTYKSEIDDSDFLQRVYTYPALDSLYKSNTAHLDSLQKSGYFTLKYKSLQKANDSTWFQYINLGPKTDSITVNIQYADSYNTTISVDPLSRKQNISIKSSQIDSLIKDIDYKLNTAGNYFNSFKLLNFKINNNNATADLKITGNINRVINDVVIKGYTQYPRKIIARLVKQQLTLNDKNIKRIENQVTSQNLASLMKPSEVLYKQDSSKVYIYIQKTKSNYVEGMLGINNASDNDKTELNGYIDLELNNSLDKAEKLKLNYRNDGNDITTLDVKGSIPLLIYSTIGIKSSLNLTRRDSLYANTSFTAGAFLNLGSNHTLGINYTNYLSTDLQNQSVSENIKSNGINTQYTFIKQSNGVDIVNENTEFETSVGIQRREINNFNNNQFITKATFRKLWHLGNRIKFFNIINSGLIASSGLRLNELYQIGGINSIRGFAQNSVDTSRYITMINELRWSLNEQIYLYSITDLGVFEDFSTSKSQNMYGLGAGIAILTQSGIVTLSLANGSFENANLDLSSVIAHINLRIRF